MSCEGGFCYSRILQRDGLFAELFNDTLCLKDELNIAPVLLSAVRPITTSVHHQPELNVHAYSNYNRNRKKELTIKFNGIRNKEEFLKNTYIPLSTFMKYHLSKAHVIFQYYRMENVKSLAVTYFFEDIEAETILTDIQKYLYLHFSELSLRNINIPWKRPYCILDGMEGNINSEVMKTLGTLTSTILTQNNEVAVENDGVTTLIYLYIMTAKIIFVHHSDFITSNEQIYSYFIKKECSDTFQYTINNHIYTDYLAKVENEFHLLSLNNIHALYSNYHSLLNDWSRLESEDNYQQYISQVRYIKSILKEDTTVFFLEYVKQLFACYDLSAYYKTYIPYVIKYLNNEI